MAADEAELAALEHDAAIARRETARSGAVGDDMADGKLACEAFALRFEINGAGEAFEFAAAGIGAAQPGDGFGQGCARPRSFRPAGSASSAMGASGSTASSAGRGIAAMATTGSSFEPSAISGSAAGVTWAGATDDAVKAAITMKVERSGTNMQTVTWAVNRPVGVLPESAASPRVVPRLRGISNSAYMPICGCPPRGCCGRDFGLVPAGQPLDVVSAMKRCGYGISSSISHKSSSKRTRFWLQSAKASAAAPTAGPTCCQPYPPSGPSARSRTA